MDLIGGNEMNRMMLMGAACLVLAGCASTGVVPTGSNEYMISKTDIGDTWHEGGTVLAKLYIEANAFCGKQGKTVEKISEESQDGKVFAHNASATLRFRCAAATQTN